MTEIKAHEGTISFWPETTGYRPGPANVPAKAKEESACRAASQPETGHALQAQLTAPQ